MESSQAELPPLKRELCWFPRRPAFEVVSYFPGEISSLVELPKMAQEAGPGPRRGEVRPGVAAAPSAGVEQPLAPALDRSQSGSTASPAEGAPGPGPPSVGPKQSVEALLGEVEAEVVDAGLDLQAPRAADYVEEGGVWNTAGFFCLAAVV